MSLGNFNPNILRNKQYSVPFYLNIPIKRERFLFFSLFILLRGGVNTGRQAMASPNKHTNQTLHVSLVCVCMYIFILFVFFVGYWELVKRIFLLTCIFVPNLPYSDD